MDMMAPISMAQVDLDRARLVESWTWYGLCSLVFVWRMGSRLLNRGSLLRLQLDDWIMIPTFALYTNFIVWVNIQSHHPHTNILPAGVRVAELSPQEVRERIDGSIATFTVEQSMICLQWACKFCILFMFYRVTERTRIQIFVKVLIGYSLLGLVLVQVFFFGYWCKPLGNYFAVINNNTGGCTTSQDHLIMSFAFNLSSDLLILVIPFKMFHKTNLPRKKKAVLWAVLSLGVLVCLCAILSRVYCFLYPESILWIFWYVREASTAVLVANAPNCWTLLQRIMGWQEWSSLGGAFTTLRRRATVAMRSQVSAMPLHDASNIAVSQPRNSMPVVRVTAPKTSGGTAGSDTLYDDIELKAGSSRPTTTQVRAVSDADGADAVTAIARDAHGSSPTASPRPRSAILVRTETHSWVTPSRRPNPLQIWQHCEVRVEDADVETVSSADRDWEARYGRTPDTSDALRDASGRNRAFATARFTEREGPHHVV